MIDHSHICFPDGIKKTLKQDSQDNRRRKQFQKACQSFNQRPFPNGLFIKKVKGASRTILEARLNQKERLLFDYHSRYCSLCEENVPYIRILDFVYEHDDLSRRARHLNFDLDEGNWIDCEESSPQELADNNKLPGFEYFEDIVDLSTEEIENAAQWYLVDEDELDRFVQDANKDLRLLLTHEQAKYLSMPGPIIINGSAGSGKTTLGIYWLVNALRAKPSRKILYVTYFNHLRDYALDLYKALAPNPIIAEYIGQAGIYFSTFHNLCAEIVDDEIFNNISHEMTYEKFSRWLKKYPSYNGIDPAHIWIELKSIIRGLVPDERRKNDEYLSSEMLTRQEYIDLGKKETNCWNLGRDFFYDIAEKYQSYLNDKQKFDEMGLTRAALRKLTDGHHFDLLVVDEVQDLTELQIELLLRLIPRRKIFMTGDLQQVVNPNSFRWENVRSLFYARNWNIPALHKLHFNFRSRAPIVQLANHVLDLRREMIGKYADEADPEKPVNSEGLLPGFCTIGESKFIEEILRVGLIGIDIIVRTESEKNRLKDALKSSSIWTIEETKGLEFKDVILWRLADEPFDSIFSRRSEIDYGLGPLSEAAHEFNRIYVAITRTRRNLLVYEEDVSPSLWNKCINEQTMKLLNLGEIEDYLGTLKTTRDILERGHYFYDREKFEQAAESFEAAGDFLMAHQAKAKLLFTLEKYSDAATEFELAEVFNDAADAWEKSRKPLEAARCWKMAGNFSKAAEIWEQIRKYEWAAECWELFYDLERAIRNWEKVGDFSKVAIDYERLSNYQQAAIAWEKADELDKAAGDWEKVPNFSNAARCWEKVNKYSNAAQCWEKINKPQMAAHAWEKAHEYPRAAEAFLKERMFSQSARSWMLAKEFENAANCWIQINSFARAAVCWEMAFQWSKAAECWESSERYKRAAKLWQKEGKLHKALECWIRADEWDNVISLATELRKYENVAEAFEKKNDYKNAAINWEKVKLFDKAAINWEKVPNNKNAAGNWERASCFDKAAMNWEKHLNFEKAAINWERDKNFKRAAINWQQFEKWDKAARYWEKDAEEQNELDAWTSAMNCYNKSNNPIKAQFCKVQSLMLDCKWNEAGELAEKSLKDLQLARKCYGKARNYTALRKVNQKIKKKEMGR